MPLFVDHANSGIINMLWVFIVLQLPTLKGREDVLHQTLHLLRLKQEALTIYACAKVSESKQLATVGSETHA